MPESCKVAVIWIDWYAYHVARFRGMMSVPSLAGRVRGIELVGGVGVHQGLKFREDLPSDLPVDTLMPNSSWQSAGQLRLARALWRHLGKLNPEVLLVPGYYTLPAIAAAVWAKLHRRTSVLMTESTAEDHARVWWKEAAKSSLIRLLFDWAICGGKAHRRYLAQLGFPSDRVASSYDVVDNDFFCRKALELRQHQPSEFGLPSRYFLYTGRLAPEKNVEGLLAAWNDYRHGGGTWPLVLVGAGPSEPQLRAAAAALPFSYDIHFAGHTAYGDLPKFYAFAGCFVLPSIREPWGLVVNEALASGLPVIVSNRCGCAEDLVQHGHNGFVFDPANPDRLAASLQEIAAWDDPEQPYCGNNSINSVSNCSPLTFGKQVEKITASR